MWNLHVWFLTCQYVVLLTFCANFYHIINYQPSTSKNNKISLLQGDERDIFWGKGFILHNIEIELVSARSKVCCENSIFYWLSVKPVWKSAKRFFGVQNFKLDKFEISLLKRSSKLIYNYTNINILNPDLLLFQLIPVSMWLEESLNLL